MLCNQCSMSLEGGCTTKGVCGKDQDLNALQEALLYGIKGVSAYYHHALEMDYDNPEVGHFLVEVLYSTLTNVNFDKNRFLEYILECGKVHLEAMRLLDQAYVETFGEPEPTRVSTGTEEGHGILVTGHSYRALYELLKQTEDTSINVYTHSEMLPAHSYPELKKFDHLVANWGGSWVPQKREFSEFPGVILGTTNCVLQPKEDYADRIFTVGIAGLEGVPHIEDYDFEPLIEKAKETPKLEKEEGDEILTGFHHTNVLAMKDELIDLIQEGKISHIFVVGGCDAPNPEMKYYEKFVELIPEDAIILTAGCGKFRYNMNDYGTIEGIPRFLDFGQCNNVYSIIEIALALVDELDTDVNSLPVSIVLSWMEQKAIAILYTLLYLGVKGIYVGPKAPEFLTPKVFKTIREEFDLRLISGDPEKDLKKMLSELEGS
ncbi:hydroxylamine reductase [Methanopyrus kandleri]